MITMWGVPCQAVPTDGVSARLLCLLNNSQHLLPAETCRNKSVSDTPSPWLNCETRSTRNAVQFSQKWPAVDSLAIVSPSCRSTAPAAGRSAVCQSVGLSMVCMQASPSRALYAFIHCVPLLPLPPLLLRLLRQQVWATFQPTCCLAFFSSASRCAASGSGFHAARRMMMTTTTNSSTIIGSTCGSADTLRLHHAWDDEHLLRHDTQGTRVERVTLRWCLQLDAAASARFDGRRTHPSELLLDDAVFILPYALFAALLLVDLVLSCTADTRIPCQTATSKRL